MFAGWAAIIGAATLVLLSKPESAWIPLGLLCLWYGVSILSVHSWARSLGQLDGLSFEGLVQLKTYPAFYRFPFAGKQTSATASLIALLGLLLAGYCAFRGFWLGILFGAVNYMAMGYFSKQFNPTAFLQPDEEAAHWEVVRVLHGFTPRDQTKQEG